jgi:F-type H+-transporting ATPase subunit b
MRVFSERQKELDEKFSAAEKAKEEGEEFKAEWEKTLSSANQKADEVLQSATEKARARHDRILNEAKEKAENMILAAKEEAELEKKKAEDEIRREIVEVSEALAEKMLEREIHAEDHRNLIDSFLEKIGEEK